MVLVVKNKPKTKLKMLKWVV